MLIVDERIRIPSDELRFEFARAGGPGGQNVNKVASKAILRWNPGASPSLPEDVRARLLGRFAHRLTADGELILTSQRTRDQGRNVEDCLEKLRALVLAVARPPRPRIPTRPTMASRRRRAEQKAVRSARKRDRRPPAAE
jgi:ribosome-associated protein